MDDQLQRLVSDYIATVAARFVQLQHATRVAAPRSNSDWASNGMKKSGVLPDGAIYQKHGYGCLFEFEGGTVDFDFGDHGETDGFDVWRLRDFAEAAAGQYSMTEEKLRELFDSAVASGEIEKRGALYYLRR